MAGTGFYSAVANRAQMCTVDHGINNHTVDCHSQESKFDSGLPKDYIHCCKPRYMHLRMVIPVVANHGIGARFATTE
jgi:hypothetical protein